jgi:hypothetical protein
MLVFQSHHMDCIRSGMVMARSELAVGYVVGFYLRPIVEVAEEVSTASINNSQTHIHHQHMHSDVTCNTNNGLCYCIAFFGTRSLVAALWYRTRSRGHEAPTRQSGTHDQHTLGSQTAYTTFNAVALPA